jgi:predicted TPR repeat methyltransferase
MCINHSYSGPTVAAEQLAQKLKEFGYTEDARIMDLGCGTGLVGVELQKRGYKNIDGVDLMPEMLEEAKAKGVYGSLQQGSMGSPGCKDLGVDANQYDAVICVGVFTLAHVKSEGFDDLLHVVKPGGLVCFSIREMALNATKYGYREKMAQFGEEGKWKLLSKHHKSVYLNDDSAWCFVYQKL